ncbi:MAG: 16S rRNA (cytosine(1402)-N(4))-methyltransferase RsmH [Deltaproteobacteria bacterium]|nr:16S rRNA (cytosine(1402)-N(4))-methyltransferase RsmH [Deltaproteobacteria bacterium]MBW1952694.1 16S rRNA (cytosine(1402)-N(4))-methyltransferase RsmH [Deltaproteobacteria bacterium]MBW2133884.1 16S rRNA (cytosine(1402)-N(4))-methyltransferase RsmH [Deltaproteobacteria bacterium]
MVAEVVAGLNCRTDQIFVDGTVGLGGHAQAILIHSAPAGQLVGLDQDPAALRVAAHRLEPFQSRVRLFHSCYTRLGEILTHCRIEQVAGILLDLGLSTQQLKQSGRGFSFLGDEPLDMRLNPEAPGLTAAEILNTYPEPRLTKLFLELGEERWSRRIARRIVTARQQTTISTTAQLVKLIMQAIPPKISRGRIHPATRVFQALRIAVNQELERLTAFIPLAVSLLAPGGRLVIISYHSLEDRIVKHQFLALEKAGQIRRLTRKPLTPSRAEVQHNPQARSAKLRVGEKAILTTN